MAWFHKWKTVRYLAGLFLDWVALELAPAQPHRGKSAPESPTVWFGTQPCKWPVQKVRIYMSLQTIPVSLLNMANFLWNSMLSLV